MTVDDLRQQIEETERLIAVYRNADEVIVGTQDQIYSRRGLVNRTIFTAAEIGGQIVSILERRVATMRAELPFSICTTQAKQQQSWSAGARAIIWSLSTAAGESLPANSLSNDVLVAPVDQNTRNQDATADQSHPPNHSFRRKFENCCAFETLGNRRSKSRAS
jgi:hypothetical protein